MSENGKDATIKDAPKFKTTDIEAAAALMTSGHQLLDYSKIIKKVNNKTRSQTQFVFLASGTKEILSKFMNGELTVNAKVLLNNLKHLKSLAYMSGVR